MGDIIILFFFQNILLFTFIFWFLTWAGEYFFKKKNHFAKHQFYECGFKNINDLNLQTNFNFIIFAVFLILYDAEFLFFIPLIFNFTSITPIILIIIYWFFAFLLFSLIYDWQTKALNWQI